MPQPISPLQMNRQHKNNRGHHNMPTLHYWALDPGGEQAGQGKGGQMRIQGNRGPRHEGEVGRFFLEPKPRRAVSH